MLLQPSEVTIKENDSDGFTSIKIPGAAHISTRVDIFGLNDSQMLQAGSTNLNSLEDENYDTQMNTKDEPDPTNEQVDDSQLVSTLK